MHNTPTLAPPDADGKCTDIPALRLPLQAELRTRSRPSALIGERFLAKLLVAAIESRVFGGISRRHRAGASVALQLSEHPSGNDASLWRRPAVVLAIILERWRTGSFPVDRQRQHEGLVLSVAAA